MKLNNNFVKEVALNCDKSTSDPVILEVKLSAEDEDASIVAEST